MKEKKIDKGKIKDFIKNISEKYKVFGPVKRKDYHLFAQITKPEELDGNYVNSLFSPKGIFFPQSENLYRFRDDQIIETPVSENGQSVIMFIRPCDARALSFFDDVFRGKEFQDPYFLNRRENALIVSLACNQPATTCFCTSLEGNPSDETGSDIIFFDLGDTYIAKIVSKKGEDYLKSYDKWFGDAKKTELDKVNILKDASRKKVVSKVTVKGLKDKLGNNFEADFWKEIHQKCIGCGTCTYLCSTCYFFDITDEMQGAEGRRVRSWDSCMFPLFTLHASGHNPRPSGKERMRQRIMHKFNYCLENFKKTFCIGCGRCVKECPVNLDIRQVLNTINRIN